MDARRSSGTIGIGHFSVSPSRRAECVASPRSPLTRIRLAQRPLDAGWLVSIPIARYGFSLL
jgi:hypothetical protein